MKTSPPPTESEVVAAFRDAKRIRIQFLKSKGWEMEGDFPDGKLRWVKAFKGRDVTMNPAGAFALETGVSCEI